MRQIECEGCGVRIWIASEPIAADGSLRRHCLRCQQSAAVPSVTHSGLAPRQGSRVQLTAGTEAAPSSPPHRPPGPPPPPPRRADRRDPLRARSAPAILAVRPPPDDDVVEVFFVDETTDAPPACPMGQGRTLLAEQTPPALVPQVIPPALVPQVIPPVLVPQVIPPVLVPHALAPAAVPQLHPLVAATRAMPPWAWAVVGGLVALACTGTGAALVTLVRAAPAADKQLASALTSPERRSEAALPTAPALPLAERTAPSGSAGDATATRGGTVAPSPVVTGGPPADSRPRSSDPQRPAADSDRRSPKRAATDVAARSPASSAGPIPEDDSSAPSAGDEPSTTEESRSSAVRAATPSASATAPAEKPGGEEEAPVASPAKAPQERGDKDEIANLLESTRAAHQSPEPPPRGNTDASGLPERLDTTDVNAGMRRLRPEIDACFARYHITGTAMVHTVIAGTGRVESANVVGALAGTPTAECVTTAVRAAGFKRFSGRPMTIDYPFLLR